MVSSKLKLEISKHPTFTILNDNKNDNILIKKYVKPNFKLPNNFKGQDIWKSMMSPVQHQGECGSCWAYATSSTLTSRFNIQSKGKLNLNLCAQRLVLCAGSSTFNFDMEDLDKFAKIEIKELSKYGCYGNTLVNALINLTVIGTFSCDCLDDSLGSKFDSLSTNISSENLPICNSVTGQHTDLCQDNLINMITGQEIGSAARFYSSILFYNLPNNERQIRIEIFKWGPVVTGMILYEDFFLFNPSSDGIYKWDNKSKQVSGHAVEIVGWGVENKQKFWWVKNTWGVHWGINGFFKISRGNNMCNIEQNCYGIQPDFFYPNFNDYFNKIKNEYTIVNKKAFYKLVSATDQLRNYIIPNSGFGGIDSASGYSIRIIQTRPWINNSRIISLNELPDWSSFVAGNINEVEPFSIDCRKSNCQQYQNIIILIILSIIFIIIYIFYILSPP